MLNVETLFPTTRTALLDAWGIRAAFTEPGDDWGDYRQFEREMEWEKLREYLSELSPVGRAVALELRRYTYKPGFTMQVMKVDRVDPVTSFMVGPPMVPVRVRFTMQVPDARHKGVRVGRGEDPKARRTVEVVSVQQVPYHLTEGSYATPEERERDFAEWVRRALTDLELHERDEWIRRDGELLFDPHAQKTPSAIGPIHDR